MIKIQRRQHSAAAVILGILLLATVAMPAHSAENAIPSYKVRHNFYDVDFVDAQTGWLGGKSGYVFATRDGGATWERIKTGVDGSIFGIDFHDQSHGVLVGQAGLVMITDDGGLTWQRITSPQDKTFLTMDFYDDKIGMAAGDWGKIIVTQDGGKTWEDISLDEDILLYDMKYTGPEEIWMAAEMGHVFHSVDGGKTWTKIWVTEGTLFGIDMDENGNGIAVGMEGTVLVTRDSWKTWEQSVISRESLYSVRINDDRVLAVGDAGSIFTRNFSPDGDWRQVEIPNYMAANWLQCIFSLPGKKFIIAGARGSINLVADGNLVSPSMPQDQ